jgi:AraC-like DNA-binding protein
LQHFSAHPPSIDIFRPVPSDGAEPASELTNILGILGAVDELTTCRDADAMWRLSVELGRERLGLERLRVYLRERAGDGRVIMRGTWGTGVHGQTTNEHHLYHEFLPDECEALLGCRAAGHVGMYHARAPWFATEPGPNTVLLGEGWVVATPIVAARELVGVMYNDCALSGGAVDERKQSALAVYSSMLGVLSVAKRNGSAWQSMPPKAGQSPLVMRVLQAVSDDLPLTGEQLAQELGVSPGHLARSFKREMGISLVDYRNRRRIDRFFEAISRAGGTVNLLDAALEAGFGSYAQFHRVYRKFLGTAPREVLAGSVRSQYRAARDAPPHSERRLRAAGDVHDGGHREAWCANAER